MPDNFLGLTLSIELAERRGDAQEAHDLAERADIKHKPAVLVESGTSELEGAERDRLVR